MAQLYRKSALEKFSSPEQLDKVLTVTSPMSWLVLLALTLVIVVTVIWSVIGTIPVTVTASGIIHSPEGTNAIFMPESGKIQTIYVNLGEEIQMYDRILDYTIANETRTLYSDQFGIVADIYNLNTGDTTQQSGSTGTAVSSSTIVNQGTEVVRISVQALSPQVAVCYVKLSDAEKIERGMLVNISLSSRESQTYGHMVGRVINIDSYVSSTKGMTYVLGSENNLISTFQKDGSAVVAVTCELYPDSSTVSGYYWSTTRGAKLEVADGSLVNAKVIVEEVRPITKLFSKLREIWEG